jgi:glycine hydroxymethyltransferase
MNQDKIFSLLSQHTKWRREECLNLIPSENVASPQVCSLLASDLGNRYTLNMDTLLHGVQIKNAYGGTKYTDAIETEAENIAKDVYNAKFCSLKPLSGHIAAIVMLAALCKPKDTIMVINAEFGGYDGYLQEYMPDLFNLKADYLPFNEKDWNLDHDAAVTDIREKKPHMVILGASFFLFPYNIKPIREVCDELDILIGYDASHVLGLIAGGEFQDPLGDGVDIVTGSTHKTLFGPQGGLILTNREDVFDKVDNKFAWHTMDNAHQHKIAALGYALLEMKEFGSEYAKQVISNAKTLARKLHESKITVKQAHNDFTESHQVLLDIEQIEKDYGINPVQLMNLFESENIIIDTIGRIGTNEMTRRGCTKPDMETIAEFIKRVLVDSEKNVKEDIKKFLAKFDLEYCFKN